MNNEILALLDFFERDRGIKRDVLLEAINTALLTAARKAVGPARDLRDPAHRHRRAHLRADSPLTRRG
jgi:N utilization substance protein A